MAEYCLVTEHNTVLNMCQTTKPDGPVLTEYQAEKGWSWVPVHKVPRAKLTEYRFWDERP